MITSDKKKAISCSKDKTIKIWNLADKKLEVDITSAHGEGTLLKSHLIKESITCLALAHHSKFFVTGGKDKKINIWNLEGKCQHSFSDAHDGNLQNKLWIV